MRNRFLLALAGVGLCVGAGQSSADEMTGEIKRIEGAVMITQGEHFVSAREGMQLREFDRLMALEDSSALLEFSDGCRYEMTGTELLTVGSESVCEKSPGALAPDAISQMQGGGTEAMAIERSATSLLEAGVSGPVWVPAVAALGVVGGVIAVSNNTGGGGNSIPFGAAGDPVSPE